MATFTATLDDRIVIVLPPDLPLGYGVALVDTPAVDDTYGNFGYGVAPIQDIGMHEEFIGYNYNAGALADDDIKIAGAPVPNMRLTPALSDSLGIKQQLLKAQALALVESLGLDDALSLAYAVTLLQKAGVHDSVILNAVQSFLLSEAVKLKGSPLLAFGLSWTDVLGVHGAFAEQFQFGRSLTQAAGLADSFLTDNFIGCIVDDSLRVEDSDIPNLIINSSILAENISITIGTIDPGGGFTSWAVNTRTSVVTEYQNWAFNSFAQIGDDFYGANDDGLWLLSGPTDGGSNTVADIRGAVMQFGGSRYAQFETIYIGMNTDDNSSNWYLKLIIPHAGAGGEDATYIYQFRPKNYQTTRVDIGKGFRARYIQWELITPGPEFVLDSIEFVPLIAKRRVN